MTTPKNFDKSFLTDSSPALREMMTSLSTQTLLKEGEVLFRQGDEGDALYVIVSGKIEFSALSAEGRKLSLNIMGKGGLFGEIALFDPGPRTATATAFEQSMVWGVSNAAVMNALQATPALYNDMIQLAGKRMRWMDMQLSEQVFLPMPVRLARKILHLTAKDTAEIPSLQMSQNQLAEFVGATRESVSRSLTAWKREHIIDLSRGGLEVLDRAALKEIADSQVF